MKLGFWLQENSKRLTTAGIDSARLDCLILLEDVLGKDRAYLLAHPEIDLSSTQIRTLNNFVTQRQRHLPLAYIRGQTLFYGRAFTVNKHVLVPRPETEAIVTLLKSLSFSRAPVIADIGTGSGCIGITAALEVPEAVVHMLDSDTKALEVAKTNARKHQVRTHCLQSDLLAQCPENVAVLLANLPYVPLHHPINQAAAYEPPQALFSGTDGLDHYRRFWQQIHERSLQSLRHVIIEALPQQHARLNALAAKAGFTLKASDGFAQHFSSKQ